MDDEELIKTLESMGDDVPESICLRLKPLIQSSYLPELKFAEERPFEETDFVDHQVLVHKNFKTLTVIFKKINEQVKSKNEICISEETVHDLVLLCGEHLGKGLWTTKETIEYAQALLNIVLQLLNFDSFIKFLFEFKKDFINTLLFKLRPKLLKATWKKFPAAVSCYKWLLLHIKSPHLSDHFETVLPTALIILDDHEFHNRISGMKCIEHIVNNITKAELNWYGRGNLLYKTLEPMVYFREPELLPTLISCLIAVLKKTECDPSGQNLKWSHFDDVLNVWLPGMEMEQNIASRLVNLECLCDFLKVAKLSSLRWSQKLLNIITEYSAEKNTCQKSLEALLVFMDIGWPRLQHHCPAIFIILMKVSMDLSELEDNTKPSRIVPLLKTCMIKLKQAAPTEVTTLCVEVSERNELRSAYSILLT